MNGLYQKCVAFFAAICLAAIGVPFVGAAGENLALQGTATASSYDEDHIAAHAVDGNATTRWASKGVDDSWLAVDLGETCRVTAVTLVWEAAYAEAYKLQTSPDGAVWTDVYETDQGRGGTETVSLNVMTRFVRMKGIARTEVGGVKYGYSLYEFQVNGLRPKADKSDLTAAISRQIKEELYTPESLAVYAAALEQARTVEEDIESSPEQVAAALGDLLTARDGLVFRQLGEQIGHFSGRSVANNGVLDIGTLRADAPIDLYGRDLTRVYLLFTVTLTNPSDRPDSEVFNTGNVRLRDGKNNAFTFSVYNMRFGFHAGENVLYFPLVDVSRGYGRPESEDFDWHDVASFQMYIDSMGSNEGTYAMTVSDIVMWDVSAADEPDVLPGDVDGDGSVTAADALMALQAATGKIDLSEAQVIAADADGDKAVTAADALMILQFATGRIAAL